MKAPLLTVSIVHFNTAEITKKCISSVMNVLNNSPLADNYEISVVDNRSKLSEYNDIFKFINELNSDKVFLQRNCMNSGFGLGCMLTLNKSAGEYIAFVNSDTFFEEDCFTPLIQFMRNNHKVGVVTPQHCNGNGDKIKSFGFFEGLGSRFIGSWARNIKWKFKKENVSNNSVKVDFVFGSFMMVRCNAFAKVGGVDPNIFLYYEEMDLCLRLRKIGFDTYFYPCASFRHIGNASTGEVSEDLRFESLLSMIYVVRKHNGAIYGLIFYITLLFQYLLKALFKSRNRRIFLRLIKAISPQACSMRIKQDCEFIKINK